MSLPKVAKVVVDLDVPHLDRSFDYQIPPHLQEEAAVGSLVRVKWGGRRINGWIVEVAQTAEHRGKLAPLLRVLSVMPLFTPSMLTTYRYIAARFAVNLSQVLSLALPVRRQKVEEALLREQGALAGPLEGEEHESQQPSWSPAEGLPRVALQLIPHREVGAIAEVIDYCQSFRVPAIITAPTIQLARKLRREVSELLPELSLGFMAAELPQTSRYEAHLRTLRGDYDAVIGTRTAVWAPFRDPALQLVWQAGSDHYRERRAPRLDVLDVAVARSRWEHFGLVSASLGRTIKEQALVHSGWARSIEPSPIALRSELPRIGLADGENFDREGLAALSTLPNAAFRAIREGLREGPVLVQVMGVQRFFVLPCGVCGEVQKCDSCGTPFAEISRPETSRSVRCPECSQINDLSICRHCGSGKVAVKEFGAERIGRELGRAFPQTPVVVSSSASKIRRTIRPLPQIVVATAGAEPAVREDYAAVVIAEADKLAYSDRFGALEDALNRWLNTFAMARPGAPAVLSGDVPAHLARAIVRWRPVIFAQEQLQERIDIGLYPARWVVSLQGSPKAVGSMINRLESGDFQLSPATPPLEVLGFAQYATPELLLDDDSKTSAILACEPSQAMSLMHHLKTLANERSIRRESKVSVTVNPQSFLGA